MDNEQNTALATIVDDSKPQRKPNEFLESVGAATVGVGVAVGGMALLDAIFSKPKPRRRSYALSGRPAAKRHKKLRKMVWHSQLTTDTLGNPVLGVCGYHKGSLVSITEFSVIRDGSVMWYSGDTEFHGKWANWSSKRPYMSDIERVARQTIRPNVNKREVAAFVKETLANA